MTAENEEITLERIQFLLSSDFPYTLMHSNEAAQILSLAERFLTPSSSGLVERLEDLATALALSASSHGHDDFPAREEDAALLTEAAAALTRIGGE